MKSYIKIYGPPLLPALKTLQKLAIDFPEVCIMDPIISADLPGFNNVDYTQNYFSGLGMTIDRERCGKIISKSKETLGKNDFYFEWFTKPTMDQIIDLIEKIDKALEPTGVRYTITTK